MRTEGILYLAARSRAAPRLTPDMLPCARFRPGPLRNLPSQAYLSALLSTGDARALGVALLMVLRDAFDPSALQDIALRRQCNAVRDAILPRDAMRQRAILERFATGQAKPLGDALGLLITLLADHPQREALRRFASQLFLRDFPPAHEIRRNPLVAAMLAGLGLFSRTQPPASSVLQ
ncbi:hypothetical protein AB870_12325 [Pandoraea faecigallinarum]|uniref:Uncharacterized protein n=1 Tax=Pandoraea faecigallinarum TaxID=656179 RepID=A0A0H3WSX1_9BURK|nr:hypothetical protein [Pandoraea faecigallinarum]AKM30725.1 hypothetical protein AB870_12325 [Pandoraea faecigallinarum]